MTREMICIVCPRGCSLTVELEGGEIKNVSGYTCKRGLAYAETECTHPTRMLTTTMATEKGEMIAVRTDKPIPKELLFDSMKIINTAKAPNDVKVGNVLIENILSTGANIIASQNAR